MTRYRTVRVHVGDHCPLAGDSGPVTVDSYLQKDRLCIKEVDSDCSILVILGGTCGHHVIDLAVRERVSKNRCDLIVHGRLLCVYMYGMGFTVVWEWLFHYLPLQFTGI
jgi:hypothetical protein